MEERERVENEISLKDVFNVLLDKIKLVVIVFLTGCLLGGVFGYAKSYDVVYYGTDLTFFVSPKKSTDNEGDDSIYGTYGNTVMDSMVKLLSTEKSISYYLEDMEGVPKKPVYEEGMDEEVYADEVLAYNEFIYKVKKSLTFTYKEDGSVEVESSDTESKNFIYVTLSVQEEGDFDKEFTRIFLGHLQLKIPKVVEGSMLNPDESQFEQTSCTLVTPLYPIVKVMNEGYALKQTFKYAVLFGLASFLLVCAIVIMMDRMDKRIKDAEKIEEKFNIPLLGTIPSLPFPSDENGGDLQ